MTRFEKHLLSIHQAIALTDSERQRYTHVYDTIRDHLIDIMKNEDVVFRQLFAGTTLFGSYANNVRINKPKEFDVLIVLAFPYSYKILVEADEDRPGFVTLDFCDVMDALDDRSGYGELKDMLWSDWTNDNGYFLYRKPFQNWLKSIIKNALIECNRFVRDGYGNRWNLQYSKRGLAHTIYATCGSESISIDFVPAIKFTSCDWLDKSKLPIQRRFDKWYACPKPKYGRGVCTHSFLICNPEVEKCLLTDKQNLKIVLRLLKSLLKGKKMYRFRSYFLTTAFLWEIDNQPDSYWYRPVSEIFIHMLDKLDDYLQDMNLPFYWDDELNLFDILSDELLGEYRETLRETLLTLQSYDVQPKLSLARCASHFQIRGSLNS